MIKRQADKKELIKAVIIFILVFLGGIAFTAASFCVYFLVIPRNTAVIVSICIVDFLYCICSTCLLFKHAILGNGKKWLLKGALLSVGYAAVFFVAALLFLLTSSNGFQNFTNEILRIVIFAFFTSPCFLLMILLYASF